MPRYKVKLSSLLFYLALFLWILNFMLGQAAISYPPVVSKAGQLVVTGILILKWLAEKHLSLARVVWAVIIVITCAIVYLTGGYGALFATIFLIISVKDINFNKILKFFLKETLVIAGILFVLSQIGVIPDYTYSRDFVGGAPVAHSYGFIYYSMPSYISVASIIGYCYFRRGKCSYIELFVLFVLNYLIFRLITARLTYFAIALFLLGYIVVYKFKWVSFRSRFWLIFATVAPTFLMILNFISIILSINGVLDFGREYFGTFNARFVYPGIVLQRYGLHLFGTEIETVGRASAEHSVISEGSVGVFIDSGYMLILLKYGIIFSIVLLVLYTILFRYFYRNGDKFCFLWLSLLLVISISNDFLTNPMVNQLMFLIPNAFSRKLSRNVDKSMLRAENIPTLQ